MFEFSIISELIFWKNIVIYYNFQNDYLLVICLILTRYLPFKNYLLKVQNRIIQN